jgi:hypothetical protein
MTAATPTLEALQTRLERLERQNRVLRRGGLAMLLVAGAAVLVAAEAAPKGQIMQGERFSLKDAQGRERAWLGIGREGPVLRFLNENGRERAGLEMGREGIVLRVLDSKGYLQTGLSLEKSGVAVVSIDEAGTPLVGERAVKTEAGVFFGPNMRKPAP